MAGADRTDLGKTAELEPSEKFPHGHPIGGAFIGIADVCGKQIDAQAGALAGRAIRTGTGGLVADWVPDCHPGLRIFRTTYPRNPQRAVRAHYGRRRSANSRVQIGQRHEVTGERYKLPAHRYTMIAGPQALQRFLSYRRIFADTEARCTWEAE
jgi:hypothetical protein